MKRRLALGWAATTALVAPLVLGAGPAHAATAATPFDVDGDGRPDLVVGAPRLNHGDTTAAGGLLVFPVAYQVGNTGDPKIVTQSSSKVAGASEPYDYFGSALASGDFDADGFADVAVGIPGEDKKDNTNGEGAVTVLYGTAKGLTGSRSAQFFEPSGAHKYAGFGAALAGGDLNADGYADLVVGAPDDETPTKPDGDYPPGGTVTVLYGGKGGITTKGSRLLRGDRSSDWDLGFGSSLAVADVDDDAVPDVVVVSQGAYSDEDRVGYPGSLSFCAGVAKTGPTGCQRLLHNRALSNATAVVVGNVSGDTRPEVLVGVPTNDIDSDAGSVQVVRLAGKGSSTTAAASRFDKGDAGFAGSDDPYAGNDFGASVAVGKVDSDGYADVLIGAPGERVSDERAGRVFLVRGGAEGLATSGNLAYDQDSTNVPGGSEDEDAFGASVALLDHNADGKLDLVVGAPGEDDGNGRVTVLLNTGSASAGLGSYSLGVKSADPSYDNRYDARFGAVLGS